MKRFFVILFFLLPLSILYSQVTINVPGDYTTIQAAINAANNGDLVLVADGTYLENINFKGKAITVASHFINDGDTSHITNTIIDGSMPSHPDTASVVYFTSGEDTTAMLKGFTITGGTGTNNSTFVAITAGGILIYNSSARIENNIIENNNLNSSIYTYGGGILIYDEFDNQIVIKNNVIRDNNCTSADVAAGGGIVLHVNGNCSILNNEIMNNSVNGPIATGGGIDIWGPINGVFIISNLIKGNSAQTNSLGGGGIDIYNCETNTPVIENNVIVDNYSSVYGGGVFVDLVLESSFKSGLTENQNTAEYGDVLAEQFLVNNTIYNNNADVCGGGIYTHDMTSNIMNCILWGNTAPVDRQISGTATVTYSDVDGGWTGTGNINEFPLFDMGSEFYHLLEISPCVDSGNPGPQYNDVEDPNNLGNALYPAHLTLRNDIGHGGGPASLWGYWEWPIPVELTSFTATTQFGIVNLHWTTATETNNLGFEVERKILSNQNLGEWVTIGFKEGHGTTIEPKEYSYTDDVGTIPAFSLAYRLKQIDFNGSYEYSDEVLVDNPSPIDFALHQNYPNPFNPSTTISYSLPINSQVKLVVYNALGESVMQLVNEEKEAGTHRVSLNAATLPSGVYFYQINAGDFVQVRKMMLLK